VCVCLSVYPSVSLPVCRRSFVRLTVNTYCCKHLIMLQITECFLRHGKNDSVHGRNCGCSQDATNTPAINLRVPVNDKVTQRHESINRSIKSLMTPDTQPAETWVRVTRLQKGIATHKSYLQPVSLECLFRLCGFSQLMSSKFFQGRIKVVRLHLQLQI